MRTGILASLTVVVLVVIFNPLERSMAENKKVANDWEDPYLQTISSPDLPSTARELDVFKRIHSRMTMRDIIRLCGLPDSSTGSGIFVLTYRLQDGSSVEIKSKTDRISLWSVKHHKDKKTYVLLEIQVNVDAVSASGPAEREKAELAAEGFLEKQSFADFYHSTPERIVEDRAHWEFWFSKKKPARPMHGIVIVDKKTGAARWEATK